jgi:hypothetical protein
MRVTGEYSGFEPVVIFHQKFIRATCKDDAGFRSAGVSPAIL